MSNEAFTVKKRSSFLFNPYDLVLITDENDPLYDPRVHLPIDDGLVKNILKFGVVQPVVITKQLGKPVVIDGRQRVKAAREASAISEDGGGPPILVQCVYRTGGDESMYGLIVSTNEHRYQESVIDKAKKANHMIDLGCDHETVALSFGVSISTIRNWLDKLSKKEPEKVTKTVRTRRTFIRKKIDLEKQLKATDDETIRSVLLWVLGQESSFNPEE